MEFGAVYSELLLNHFRNPRNVGELPPPAVTVEASNPACGDVLRLSVLWEAGMVACVRYKCRGCTASVAAGSALTELMAGKSRAALAGIRATEIEVAAGGLPPESKHAAALCFDALKKVLAAAPATLESK